MNKVNFISGKAIPLPINDVDTDLIIPAQYLTSVSKQGYGEKLFSRLREKDANFVFNQERFAGANILITLANFGCGSSREHAVWALQQAGIEAVIAISFADIFFSNSSKNGLVLIKLPEHIITSLLTAANQGDYLLTIDIDSQRITSSSKEIHNFDFDPFRKHCLLNGLDDLDYLLSHKDKIKTFKQKDIY